MEKKKKKHIYKRWWFILLAFLIIAGAARGAAGGNKKKEEDAVKVETPEPTLEPVYTAEPDSMKSLLLSVMPKADEISVTQNGADWIIEYMAHGKDFLDETAFLRSNLSAYVDFCRKAYTIDGIESVVFFVSTTMRDARGGDSKEGVFNIEMPKEKFSLYKWDNVRLVAGSIDQIEADCTVFWIHPGVKSNAKMDKVYYS